MAEDTEKKVLKGIDRLVKRYGGQYPDRNWEDEASRADLYDIAADDLDKRDKERDDFTNEKKKFNELFNKDPMSAELYRNWANGESPITQLVTRFGDKLSEALQSEEGKKDFAAAHEKYLEREAANAKADEEYLQNMKATFANLDAYGDSKGYNDDQKAELFMKAHQFVLDALDGTYSEDFFRMVDNGQNYDTDVAAARVEGEVAGRNARIRRELRQSKAANSGMPASFDSNSYSESETDAEKKPERIPMFNIPAAPKKKR